MNQKNDIFVGNLAFNTTEEQLYAAFSELGRVINVRMVTDPETGRSKGFAFVEYEDPHAALGAIRNMNDHELNGRRLRVNFSNSSHLEQLAGSLGMDLSNAGGNNNNQKSNSAASALSGGNKPASSPGTNAVAEALRAMSKAEMYDVTKKLKEIADQNPDEARRILAGHPQLPEAMLFIMSKLDMVQTPLPVTAVPLPPSIPRDPRAAASIALPPPPAAAAAPRIDPRQAAAAASARVDPRQAQRVDPRQQQAASTDPRLASGSGAAAPAISDPRQRQQQTSLPPQQMDPRRPAPPPPPPPRMAGGFDPSLVQQVMNLTPQQIAQLPPEKQQSIMQMRQQIMGGR